MVNRLRLRRNWWWVGLLWGSAMFVTLYVIGEVDEVRELPILIVLGLLFGFLTGLTRTPKTAAGALDSRS